VVPGQIHRDLVRAEVVALAQVDDLSDDLGLGRVRDVVRARRPITQALLTVLFVPPLPLVERRPADPVIPAGLGDAAGDFLGVAQDRQPMTDLALLFDLGHGAVLSQTGPAVNDLRQF
jgi:hypothetical protein